MQAAEHDSAFERRNEERGERIRVDVRPELAARDSLPNGPLHQHMPALHRLARLVTEGWMRVVAIYGCVQYRAAACDRRIREDARHGAQSVAGRFLTLQR